MTEIKPITLAELRDGITEIFARSEQALQNDKSKSLGKEIKILVILDEESPLYDHIEVMLSMRIARDGKKWARQENLSIRNISIADKDSIVGLDIRSPNGVIRKASLENIEFLYSEYNDCIITVDNCFSVELIKCTAVNCGELTLKYNMPDRNTIGHEIIVRGCQFKEFYVKAGYHKEGDDREVPENKYKVNLYMEFDGNVFPLFTLKLSESTIVGYKYGYNAKLVRGNDIEEIIIEDEYPDVIAWSSHEKIGEKITKGFYAKTETERYQRDKNGISAIRRAREKMDGNKAVLMRFRKLAADKGDELQANTINAHIAKCDEQLMSLEGPSTRFTQAKLIMVLKRKMLYDKSFWALLLFYIGIFNLATSTIIFAILDSMYPFLIVELDLWYVFGELINPSSNPLNIMQGINKIFNYRVLGVTYIWISAIAVLSKSFSAICTCMILWIFKSWFPTK